MRGECKHPNYTNCPFQSYWIGYPSDTEIEEGMFCLLHSPLSPCRNCPLNGTNCKIECLEEIFLTNLCLKKKEFIQVVLRGE